MYRPGAKLAKSIRRIKGLGAFSAVQKCPETREQPVVAGQEPSIFRSIRLASADGGCDRRVTRGESATENHEVQGEINDVAHWFGSGQADS
jgi:hypothetical protein